MNNNIKKSQLMEVIKEVVREVIRERKKDWIQKAVKHPGRCANPGSAECPEGSPQYNLAMRFKHGDIHKDNLKKESQGGTSVPHDYAGDNERMRQMQEVAPPGFGPGKHHADIYKKVMNQYNGDPSKAYATMWKIHNKISEVAESALEECGCMDEAGLTSEAGKQYKVAPETSAQVQKDNQADKVQSEPKVNEGGKQYKVAPKRMYQVQKDNQALNVQYDPEVNETAYKTQGNGGKTFKDSPQFPKAWNDPKNP